MADSKAINYTYRENTKTPPEVSQWLRTKPENLSYPEFTNAAVMVALGVEEGSELDLDSITNSLSDMVSKGVAPSGGAPAAAASVSPDDVASAIRPAISQDGDLTRRRIEEAVDDLGQRIDALAVRPAEGVTSGEGGGSGVADATAAAVPVAPVVDLDGIARTDEVRQSIESAVSGVSEAVSAEGQATRDAVRESVKESAEGMAEAISRVDGKVDTILDAIQSAGGDLAEATGTAPADDGPNVIEDGSLTEEDLNFAVQRMKDTIRTEEQKTRNAIITKVDQAVAGIPAPADPQPAMDPAEMREMFESIKQSQALMLQSVDRKIDELKEEGAGRASSPDIVFDEATTAFFKRIHNSVSSILIRVDAMQAQLEHIQKIVERNGSAIRTLSRSNAAAEDSRLVMAGTSQFGDASEFIDSPEIEGLTSDSGRIHSWQLRGDDAQNDDGVPQDDGAPSLADDPDALISAVDADLQGSAPYVPSDEATDGNAVLRSLLGGVTTSRLGNEADMPDGTNGDSEETDGTGFVPMGGDEPAEVTPADRTEHVPGTEVADEAEGSHRPRITVPHRRHSSHAGLHHAEGGAEAVSGDGTISGDVATAGDVMGAADAESLAPTQPMPMGAGEVPAGQAHVPSPSSESVDDLIDGLDLGNVGSMASDPDELLTDTLQSLLG